MLAKLNTFALVGIDAVPVEAEVDVSAGLPKTVLIKRIRPVGIFRPVRMAPWHRPVKGGCPAASGCPDRGRRPSARRFFKSY
jgi:hypothetical protein